jgi:adenine phosphoribosyltransferase
VTGVDYALEYGTDRLEITSDALSGGQRVLVVDDLLATGGTAAACAQLVEAAGGTLCGFGFVAELAALDGRSRLPDNQPVESLIIYS